MSKMSELAAKCELAMMGRVVPITNDEVVLATEYVLRTLHCDKTEYTDGDEATKEALDVQEKLYKYDSQDNYKVKYMTVNVVGGGFRQITYIIESEDEESPEETWKVPDNVFDLVEHDYFSYMYNVTIPFESALGYTFYDLAEQGYVHRVG